MEKLNNNQSKHKTITLTNDTIDIEMTVGFSIPILLCPPIVMIRYRDYEYACLLIGLYAVTIISAVYYSNVLFILGVFLLNIVFSIIYNKLRTIHLITHEGYYPKTKDDFEIIKNTYNIFHEI